MSRPPLLLRFKPISLDITCLFRAEKERGKKKERQRKSGTATVTRLAPFRFILNFCQNAFAPRACQVAACVKLAVMKSRWARQVNADVVQTLV